MSGFYTVSVSWLALRGRVSVWALRSIYESIVMCSQYALIRVYEYIINSMDIRVNIIPGTQMDCESVVLVVRCIVFQFTSVETLAYIRIAGELL